jgi:hypothetical protein
VLRLTLLAPEIVEAIVSGPQPAEIPLVELMRLLALLWMEQRKTSFCLQISDSGSVNEG